MSNFNNLRDVAASSGPSNKERREIAARLRKRRKEMDNEKPPSIASLAAMVYLLEISNAVKCGASGQLFYRLADLIDRRTCTIDEASDLKHIGYVCSNCGQSFKRRTFREDHFGTNAQLAIPYRFCPYCGAEVMFDE